MPSNSPWSPNPDGAFTWRSSRSHRPTHSCAPSGSTVKMPEPPIVSSQKAQFVAGCAISQSVSDDASDFLSLPAVLIA